jgi:hypothetical protein
MGRAQNDIIDVINFREPNNLTKALKEHGSIQLSVGFSKTTTHII